MLDSDNRYQIILVGNERVGKTSLVNGLMDRSFKEVYEPTIGVDFSLLQNESIRFQIWDISGDESWISLRKLYYKNTSIIIYVLDSNEDTEENKIIFRDFQEEISAVNDVSNCFQTIIFTKCDDKGLKFVQDCRKEFDSFNVPILFCSAKQNNGFTEIKDTLFHFCNQFSTTKIMEEELMISAIEKYSKTLSAKHSQLARDKSTALEAIAKVCRDAGMGQHRNRNNAGYITLEQICKIKETIEEKKEIVRQHRHWSSFNWFFNLLEPSFLNRRVVSSELVNKLDVYLNQSTDSLGSIKSY